MLLNLKMINLNNDCDVLFQKSIVILWIFIIVRAATTIIGKVI